MNVRKNKTRVSTGTKNKNARHVGMVRIVEEKSQSGVGAVCKTKSPSRVRADGLVISKKIYAPDYFTTSSLREAENAPALSL